ncbi:MAG: polysaccharide deacetylase [Sphingobacteriales bacterium]|nr:MAG: polysaccharide deacetylase [Sphingobacteriales bacterium]
MGKILLSFDIEEFDMPYEYGKQIPFAQQLAISVLGTQRILALLQKHNIKATFYCTANFAIHQPEIIQQIITDGHELASHGYYHSSFKPEHLLQSKLKLEEISGQAITGYRMARMAPFDETELHKAGYIYNSSLNPTYLPGRYNNFDKPRTIFTQNGVLQLPASVSPWFRFPLFWLTFHNIPQVFIHFLCLWAIKKDGYLNTYFHPWEFTDLANPELGMPKYVIKNSGEKFVAIIDAFIVKMKSKNHAFMRSDEFLHSYKLKLDD